MPLWNHTATIKTTRCDVFFSAEEIEPACVTPIQFRRIIGMELQQQPPCGCLLVQATFSSFLILLRSRCNAVGEKLTFKLHRTLNRMRPATKCVAAVNNCLAFSI